MKRLNLTLAILSVTVVVTSSYLAAPAASAASTIHVWMTTPDLSQRLSQQPDVTLGAPGAGNLSLSTAQTYQTIDGFGAAMTDASAYLIGTKLNANARGQVMNDLYTTAGGGIGLSMMRNPLGASDFTNGNVYSYDDNADSDTLPKFSTAHDDAYIIPVLKQAESLNSSLKLLMNTWSPPGWMKTNGSMFGTGSGATLLSSKYTAFANYITKAVQSYQSKGVSVWAVTPQNEPDIDPSTYPGMQLSAGNEATFIANNLGPAMTTAGLSTKILAGDRSQADATYAQAIFDNSAAASRISGTGWHCYGSQTNYASSLSAIHTARPSSPEYVTECSTGPSGIAGDTTAQTLIGTNNWASGMLLWNTALDTNGGPKMGQGCNGCTGLVTIDQATGTYSYTLNYYELGQFSKFVRPASQRIGSGDGSGIWTQAYKNTDGTLSLVAYNTNSSPTTATIDWNGQGTFSYSLPAGSTATFTTSGAAQGAFGLRGANSGRCLDVPYGQLGVQVQVYDCVGNQNQRITASASGQLVIEGSCLAASGDGTTAGTEVILWPCNGKPSQQWAFNSDGTVTNGLSGLALDVTNFGIANGSPVELWTRLANSTQQWTRM